MSSMCWFINISCYPVTVTIQREIIILDTNVCLNLIYIVRVNLITDLKYFYKIEKVLKKYFNSLANDFFKNSL